MKSKVQLDESSRLILISNGEPYQHQYEDNQIICERLPGGLTTGLWIP